MIARLGEENGFSYVEVLVTIVILGLILTSAFAIYLQGINYWNAGDSRIELQQSLRIGADLIAKELRSANGAFTSSNPVSSHNNTYKIKNQIGYTICYKTPCDKITNPGESKAFQVAGGALRYKESTSAPYQPIASNITEMLLVYYKDEGLFEIKLTGELNGFSSSLTTKTFLRLSQD